MEQEQLMTKRNSLMLFIIRGVGLALSLALTIALTGCVETNSTASEDVVRAKLACNVRVLCQADPQPEACFAVNYEHQLAVYYGNEKELYGQDYDTNYGDTLQDRQRALLAEECNPM